MTFKDKKHFCLQPFIHAHVNSTGDMKACCISDIYLGNIKSSTVHELFHSEQMEVIRKKFLNDEPDNRCQNCYDKEASGNESLRLETLKKFGKACQKYVEDPKPIYFDLRFSNICNLKCRTCWHGNSSKWFEDAKKLNRAIAKKSLIKAFENDSDLARQLSPFIESAQEFYFAGGEPLLMEEHLWTINQLIEKKNYGCLLRYNTNLTSLHQFDKDLLELWEPFERIEILASIDGIGERGEIIRSGLNLDLFVNNLKRLKYQSNIHLKIAPTFSVLSAELLSEMHRYFVEDALIEIDDVHFNILHQPYHFNVKAFPLEQKQSIEKNLRAHIQWIESKNGSTKDWESAIDYMNQDDWSNRYQKTIQETANLDEIRKERLELKI